MSEQVSEDPATSIGKERIVTLDSTLWEHIAAGDSLQTTLDAWLAIQCRLLGSVTQGVLVVSQADPDTAGSFVPRSIWPVGTKVSTGLAGTAELVLEKTLGIIRAGSKHESSTIGYPLKISGAMQGVIVVELDDHLAPDLKQVMRQLQLGAGWFEALTRREHANQHANDRQQEKFSLLLMQQFLAESDFKTACIGLLNELAASLRCERVSLGFVHGRTIKVHSLSHTVQMDSKLNLLNAVAAAMDEALDQDAVIRAPENDVDLINRAQRQLITEHQTGAVVSVPCYWRERAVGAISFEKSLGYPFSDVEVALCEHVASHLGPLLEERRREQRWIGAKVAEHLTNTGENLIGKGHLALKVVSGLSVLTVLLLVFATADYRVTATSYLKGEQQRVIAAPFDGYIAAANYRAGDLIEQGEVIAHLDDRELLLERLRWLTTERQHLLEYDQALGEQRRSELGVIRARISQAKSQIELIDAQLERSRLRAPFDGILVSGDLSQTIGAVVRKGDKLFELVPADLYRVVLKVDETEIRHLKQEQIGELVLTALPGANLPLLVTKIGSVSVSQEGINYFEVEARLLTADELGDEPDVLAQGLLRPGMEGVAKIKVGERKLFWIWTHRFADWVGLQFWSIWP
ncbi:MAG: HlyD family efflux transporter periplasmic adaptor subunit [Pseudomonadales bacterium]|nr:HlyD family efflux transporter periplasmic adaptor subunit [Pseudomonadales bacterium]